MRISNIRTKVMGTPWRNLTFVVVETDEGLRGVGEVRMVNHTDALLGYLHEAAPAHLLGRDPRRIEELVQRMFRSDYAKAGEIMMSAIAVIEMACWDLLGQALGVPVYQLLGGAVRERIPAYANGWYQVERTPEAFHQAARRVVDRGYRALKLDPFRGAVFELSRAEARASVALVEAVRDAVGDEVEIFLEMHGRFTPAAAVAMTREMAPLRPGWIEEPVPPENAAAHVKVARAVAPLGIKVATGERLHTLHEFREIIEQQAVDVIQPDITHFGGIAATRKLAGWAESYYLEVAPHNVGGPVATAAALHLAAATGNVTIQEFFNDFADPWVMEAAPGVPPVDATDGCFPLPNGPGLGVTLDEAFVDAHPRRDVYFTPFQRDWQRRQADSGEAD